MKQLLFSGHVLERRYCISHFATKFLCVVILFGPIFLSGGCSSHTGTITPQAQSAISRLPAPVVSAFRHDYTGVISAHARTRIMPNQKFEYEIDFVDHTGRRQSVRYTASGKRIG